MAAYPEWVILRAGGRRRYNAQRQRDQAIRRHQVAALLAAGLNQTTIAAQLNVHKSTICRDVRSIASLWFAKEKCPYCKRWYLNLFYHPAPQCGAVGRPRRKRKGMFMAW